jgi:hypothetical protein
MLRSKPKASTAQGTGSTVTHSKELDRVLDRMRVLKATYGDHQAWAEEDKDEWQRLKTRKAELKAMLGVKV